MVTDQKVSATTLHAKQKGARAEIAVGNPALSWLNLIQQPTRQGLFAMAQGSAYPDVMSLQVSGLVVMMTLIGGGFVSFWGPVLGTIIFFLARDILGVLTETWLLWYGLMFIVVVMFKPEGLAGIWQDFTRSRTPKKESLETSWLASLRR